MFKVMLFAKRKAGISPEDYRRHYEEVHAPLAIKAVGVGIRRYVRNYVDHPPDGPELAFDSVTEFWWNSRAVYDAWKATYAKDGIGAAVVADEHDFMDRSTMRVAYVDEVEDLTNL